MLVPGGLAFEGDHPPEEVMWPLLLILAVPSPGDYLPCTPGLEIEYRSKEVKVVDRVIGFEKKRLCKIERRTIRSGGRTEKDAYLREILPDRVLAAGFAGAPVALRPPLLVAPLEVGTKWHFKGSDYRITEVARCEVAGRSAACVTVTQSGPSPTSRTYARGIGLVRAVYADAEMRAVALRLPKGATKPKSRKRPGP